MLFLPAYITGPLMLVTDAQGFASIAASLHFYSSVVDVQHGAHMHLLDSAYPCGLLFT